MDLKKQVVGSDEMRASTRAEYNRSGRTRPDAATVRAIVEAVEKASYWEVADACGDGCCSSRERRIDVDKLTNELKKLL